MKQVLTLFSCILFLTIYSRNSDGIAKEVDGDIIQEHQTTRTSPKNDDCNFSAKEIGRNSNNKSRVELIGLFENTRHTSDHSYGYALSLWKLDEEILGFFNLYEGDIEPVRRGPIISGMVTNDSLHFTVWTKLNKGFSDWEQSDVHLFSFSGKLTKDQLIGNFSMYNCTDETMEEKYDEQVELHPSDMWELESFENIKDWKESNSYQLDYEK
jgi:hypothetical protein